MPTLVDIIVIGAGPGGYDAAAHEAAKGKSVVIIEKENLGGTCLNQGCIPTKCLCAAAQRFEEIKNSEIFGIHTGQVSASFAQAVRHSRAVIETLNSGIETLLSKCTLVKGEAVILPDGNIKVNDSVYSAPKVIIATGSQPSSLNIPGAELATDSSHFLKTEELPSSLTIIGAGVIGIEFAYIANAYGCKVTVIEYCKEILPLCDSELAKRLRLILAEKGVTFITSAQVSQIRKLDDDMLEVLYTDKKNQQCSVISNRTLMAVGRRAVLPEGTEEAGINVDSRGFIETDNDFRTSRPGFYAVGDCNGKLMLAHVATAQSMRAIGTEVNLNVIPSAVFTSPELAMVGLTTEQCKEKGLDYVAKKALFRANGKALASNLTEGIVKIIFNPQTRLILGCHILGAHASDLIAEPTLAMAQNITVDQLAVNTVHNHPTLTEILPSAIS